MLKEPCNPIAKYGHFFLSSLVARLTHLNVEKCGIWDSNPGHSNNVQGSYYLNYTYETLNMVFKSLKKNCTKKKITQKLIVKQVAKFNGLISH
jgi:succinate-acetate transporter protein